MPPQGTECECLEYDQVTILSKSESVYSDDSLPAGVDAMVFTGRPTIGTSATKINFDRSKSCWGNDPSVFANKFTTVSGDVYLAGPGSAGALPGAASLLRACGTLETQNAGVDTRYDPASDDLESVSIYAFEGAGLWKIKGARGNFKLAMKAGDLSKLTFNFMGLFALPGEVGTFPTLAAPSDSDPLVMDYDNTPTGTFYGVDVSIDSLNFDQGNTMKPTNRPKCYNVGINGRSPAGEVVICSPGLTILDIHDLANTHTLGGLNVVQGVNAGEITDFNIPKLQPDLSAISTVDLGENSQGFKIPFEVITTAGDDDYSLIFR